MLRVTFIFSFFFSFLIMRPAWGQELSVMDAGSPDYTPIDLINDLCFGDGIEVLDVQFNGVPASVGSFSGGESFIGLEQGFIMTSGYAATNGELYGADTLFDKLASISNGSEAMYPALSDLANSSPILDVVVYTITFVPRGDMVQFRYVFASEEYPDFVCSPFNDVFGFFLTGPGQDGSVETQNLAIVPGTDLPVSINAVNNGIPGSHNSVDPVQFCVPPNGSVNNTALFNFSTSFPVYNGYTDVFTAEAAVIPCEVYTMELVLADIGDPFWDSGIFFEANSFCSLHAAPLVNDDLDTLILVEGCQQVPIEVPMPDLGDDEFPLSYTISGSAINGLDYETIPQTGQVESLNDNLMLNIQTIDDEILEGAELIRVAIESAGCIRDTIDIFIVDPFHIIGSRQITCSSEPIRLKLVPPEVNEPEGLLDFEWITGFSYHWPAGSDNFFIDVSPEETTTYSVEFEDDLNHCVSSFTVFVGDPVVEINDVLCLNEEGIVVNGTIYDLSNLSGVEIFEGAGQGGCDSVVIINLTAAAGEVNEVLCEGESVLINGTVYDIDNPSGMEIIEGATSNACDSVVHVNLDFYPSASSTLDLVIQEGEELQIGDDIFQASGNYTLTFTDENGCDSTLIINLLVETTSETISDSILIGETVQYCFDTSIFNEVATFTNICVEEGESVAFDLQQDQLCLTYSGLAPGLDRACILICDEVGVCDTTYFRISVFFNFLDAVDDYDTTEFGTAIIIPVLENDWTSNTVLTGIFLVDQPSLGTAAFNPDGTLSYQADPGFCNREDSFTYAICNDIGCDTATIFVLVTDPEEICSGVWPGDVLNDGLVNVMDFWSVGLSFGETGPLRPDASIDWVPQPAPDWERTVTFANFVVDLKYSDCNGDGLINAGDYEAIEQNYGLIHDFAPGEEAFPKIELPLSLQLKAFQADGWVNVNFLIGAENAPVNGFLGMGFQLSYDHNLIRENSLSFQLDNSWAGQLNDELGLLQKDIHHAGLSHFGLIRTDKHAIDGQGIIGNFSFQLMESSLQEGMPIELALNDIKLLLSNHDIWSVNPLSVVLNLFTDVDEELPQLPSIEVYPNPAKEVINVLIPEELVNGTLRLFDAHGRVIYEENAKGGLLQIFMNDWAAGIYFLQVRTDKEVFNKKVCIGAF